MDTDNCTMFPEGNWSECCAMHDRRYENKRLTKHQADKLLYRCVKRKANKLIATIMFIGVKTPISWIFYCRANTRK